MKPSPKPSVFARQPDPNLQPPSLDRLFDTNVDAVFGFLMARCGSRQVAEEVSSDTFTEAARVFNLGRGSEVNRGWLLDVARKRLIDHWRRVERRRLRVERFIQFRRNDNDDASDCDSAILDALESLSQRQRAALVLRYLDEYSVTEVAEALELSYQATESLLARGRRSLLNAYERSTP